MYRGLGSMGCSNVGDMITGRKSLDRTFENYTMLIKSTILERNLNYVN